MKNFKSFYETQTAREKYSVSEIQKLDCKMSDLFCYFLLALWDLLLENLKIQKNSDDVHWNVWTNIKTLYARNNIFKKRVPNTRLWIIYILIQISFLGTALGRSSECFFFLIFHRRSTIVANIFAQPMALSQLFILSWAFSYSPTKLQNYSLCESLINYFEVKNNNKIDK